MARTKQTHLGASPTSQTQCLTQAWRADCRVYIQISPAPDAAAKVFATRDDKRSVNCESVRTSGVLVRVTRGFWANSDQVVGVFRFRYIQ